MKEVPPVVFVFAVNIIGVGMQFKIGIVVVVSQFHTF